MKFSGLIQKGKLALSKEQKTLRQQFLNTLEGKPFVEEIKRYRQKKSNKQLGAWFGLFAKRVLAEFEDRGYDTSYIFKLDKPTGIPISTNVLKDYMYSVCPSYDDNSKRITIRDMDTLQMAKYFDECRNFAASQWSIYVPEPQKDWKKYEKRKMASRKKL